MAKLLNFFVRLLAHRQLSFALALFAIASMLPALKMDLFGDDLVQRLAQFKAAALPPRVLETGFVPPDSGELTTVMSHLFSYLGRPDSISLARDYGIAPWWIPSNWGAALWRPFTAFTHWVDYRLFPNKPDLMHVHNILWYAVVVFLATICYREIFEAPNHGARAVPARSSFGRQAGPRIPDGCRPSVFAESRDVSRTVVAARCVAGLAGLFFLLDKDNYGPVAYVANRGFIIALAFGLGSLLAHHRWRSTGSKLFMAFSALGLLFSLLANEGGASTLAFLLAYAFVIESGDFTRRVASLLPAAVVVLLWRAAYAGCGFGVRNFVGYVDPGYSPLAFLRNLFPRMNGLLGGQLTGIPPEIDFGLSPQMRIVLAMFFGAFSVVCAIVFLPVIRCDKVGRFWGTAMLLALIPAATVVPLSKNLGFVAVGAFGLFAAFLQHFASRENRVSLPRGIGLLSWCVATWLILAHVSGAVAARVGLAVVSPYVPRVWERWCSFESEIGDRDVIVVNDPSEVPVIIPFDRAYRGQPLPTSLRTLAPGLSGLIVTRPDASTLVLTSKGADLFDCPPLGPLHVAYALKSGNDFLFGGRMWEAGDRIVSKGFVAEVLEVSGEGMPRSVAFHFERSLDSEEIVWLYFDWSRYAHLPFVLPKVAEVTQLSGPRSWRGRK